MATIKIKLLPSELSMDFHRFQFKDVADAIASLWLYTKKYAVVATYESEIIGQWGAEQAFDLTNNPSRQEEREVRYGRHRSISVGDIVEVGGVDYLCLPAGWVVII